jgi:hypothetical protein
MYLLLVTMTNIMSTEDFATHRTWILFSTNMTSQVVLSFVFLATGTAVSAVLVPPAIAARSLELEIFFSNVAMYRVTGCITR